jgi:hypothetical protein
LVPQSSRNQLLEYLELIRKQTGYYHPLTLKRLKQKGKRFECIRLWIELGVFTLIQNLKKEGSLKLFYRKRTFSPHDRRQATDYSEIIRISAPFKASFVLFKERHNHQRMNTSFLPDHPSKIETTFRMGLKGGLHFLFDDTEPVYINSIHFHGCEHYQRNINKDRVINRLKDELRDHCNINDAVDDRTGDHTKPNSQDYDDCQLLQLSDLLVGAFRTVLGDAKNQFQCEVSSPVKKLVEKWEKGSVRMSNSRWNKGFCISECYINNGQWNFNSIIKELPDEKLF